MEMIKNGYSERSDRRGIGESVPVLLGAVALATEGKMQTCAKRVATEGVWGIPSPLKLLPHRRCESVPRNGRHKPAFVS